MRGPAREPAAGADSTPGAAVSANAKGQPGAARPLDAAALARHRRRLQHHAPPWLHGEVARRMAERLPILRPPPERIVDWAAHLGASTALLARSFPRASRLAVEAEEAARAASQAAVHRPWWTPQRWLGGAATACLEADVPAGGASLLWANMSLHHAADPQATMRQWLRALAVDGFLMFSTLGPGSLATLRRLYREQGWPSPHAAFVDMHDLGDMLVGAGFADPVMDQETLSLHWATPQALLAELRHLGGNAERARHPGLRTPRWRARLQAALQQGAGADGRVTLEFEIVYGHAVRPAPRPRLASQTELGLDEMRSMLRQRRGHPGPGRRGESP